ncbi:MAG: hypothetical protein AB1478_12330, partial [Nitrospirota bacterium]
QLTSLELLKGTMDELSGLSEVMRGKRGGVTSGIAIESLAIASQSLIRYQARKLERMLSRIGQKLIARIFQFYSNDRLLWLFGESQELEQFKFARNEIITPFYDIYTKELQKVPEAERPLYIARQAFKNFRFKVIAGSSLAMTKVQRATLAMTLYRLGIIDDEEVLNILEFPNKKTILERKRSGKGEAPKPTMKVKIPQLKSDRGLPIRQIKGE